MGPEHDRKKQGCIKLPILAGKDAFHRVPNFSNEEWDAVERVLTGPAKANRCCHQELVAALGKKQSKRFRIAKSCSTLFNTRHAEQQEQ